MAAIHVRELDQNLVDRLKKRATENDRSLESEVRHILKVAVGPTHEEMAAYADKLERLRRMTAGRKHTPAEVIIRNDRDNRDNFWCRSLAMRAWRRGG